MGHFLFHTAAPSFAFLQGGRKKAFIFAQRLSLHLSLFFLLSTPAGSPPLPCRLISPESCRNDPPLKVTFFNWKESMATSLSVCTSSLALSLLKHSKKILGSRLGVQFKTSDLSNVTKGSQCQHRKLGRSFHRFTVFAVTEGSAKPTQKDERIPSWAKPDSDEPPPWARNELNGTSDQAIEIPFYAYLLASAVTAIAAIGSIFEYVNQKPVFGVLNSDSVFYAPLLGFFVFTGIPTSAFLWFKSVQAANKAAEEQDRRDGYLK